MHSILVFFPSHLKKLYSILSKILELFNVHTSDATIYSDSRNPSKRDLHICTTYVCIMHMQFLDEFPNGCHFVAPDKKFYHTNFLKFLQYKLMGFLVVLGQKLSFTNSSPPPKFWFISISICSKFAV